ncbi:MAG: hypothetical protein KF788_06005 [Piscinibacter sp.]|nr:hypothetical protein [Piscinibacter sp.]
MKTFDTLPLLVICAAIVSCTALVAQAETGADAASLLPTLSAPAPTSPDGPAGSGLRPGAPASNAGLRPATSAELRPHACADEPAPRLVLGCCAAL